MGYSVTRIKSKKGIGYKIRYTWYERGRRHSKHIPHSNWKESGFTNDLTIEEARARASELNAQARTKYYQARRASIIERLESERYSQHAFLPERLVTQFEQRLFDQVNVPAKLRNQWNAARRLISELQLDPIDWLDCRRKLYQLFAAHHYSPSYIHSLLSLMNRWGAFYCKRNGTYFEAVPYPKGIDLAQITDVWDERPVRRGCKEAEPLTMELLHIKQKSFNSANYLWLSLSLWFGLRPIEVDYLSPQNEGVKYRITNNSLYIYQSKLVQVERKKRWKQIPILEPEQKALQELLAAGHRPKRPLPKTIKSKLGNAYTLYSGRKGFQPLMEARGHSFINISRWLGHQSIDRTWKQYTQKFTK